jgi:hypothetical protein
MMRVVGIDHLVIRVSDYQRSKAFYGRLFDFFGFEVSDEYADAIGWTNGKTRFWIGPADAQGKNTSIAPATSASTTMRSGCAAARTSMRCRRSCSRPAPPSSIRRPSITRTTMRCSSSTPTG